MVTGFKIMLLFLLVSCATSSKIVLPDGSKGYSINCDGTMVSMNTCYEKAGDLCPNGWDVINQNSNTGWMNNGNFAGSTSTKGILVKCK